MLRDTPTLAGRLGRAKVGALGDLAYAGIDRLVCEARVRAVARLVNRMLDREVA